MDLKISEQFEQILEGPQDTPVTLGYLMEHFGHRSYGLIMLALALPNMIPIYIPGLSVICGLPIFLLGYQMIRQRPYPTLPRFLSEKSFARKDFNRIMSKALPGLKKIEVFLKPRWTNLTRPNIQVIVGIGIMVLSTFMLLPLPATNIGPAFAIAILALGLAEEDGFFIAAGIGAGVLAAIITTAIIGFYLASFSAGIGYFM